MSTAQEELTPFGHALAGALGGVFSNAAVYPLDTVKTRIQAADDKGKGKQPTPSVVQLLVRILKNEGVAGYYKGFGASMLNTFSMQYAYFFFYTFVRNSYLKRLIARTPKGKAVPAIGTAMELILGAIAGALAQIFTIPVSVIATRQQLREDSPRKLSDAEKAAGVVLPPPRDNSFIGVGKEIIAEDGVTGLWTGLQPSLVLTVNPAITYGTFARLKTALYSENAKLSPWASFMLGALSKTLATVVTYPYIMAKVRLQAGTTDEVDVLEEQHFQPSQSTVLGESYADLAQQGPSQSTISVRTSTVSKPRYTGAIDVIRKVLKEQGPIGLYQGMGAQITKAVLSQALLFMMKDQFERYALVLMLVWRKITFRG